MERRRPHIRGALVTGVVCLTWILLATRRPELTYHFAPMIAALAWPAVMRVDGRRSLADAALGGAAAVLMTAAVGVGLHVADSLAGPTFWNDGPALIEAVLFAVLGAAFGVRVASREHAGWFGSVFGLR